MRTYLVGKTYNPESTCPNSISKKRQVRSVETVYIFRRVKLKGKNENWG